MGITTKGVGSLLVLDASTPRGLLSYSPAAVKVSRSSALAVAWSCAEMTLLQAVGWLEFFNGDGCARDVEFIIIWELAFLGMRTGSRCTAGLLHRARISICPFCRVRMTGSLFWQLNFGPLAVVRIGCDLSSGGSICVRIDPLTAHLPRVPANAQRAGLWRKLGKPRGG